MHTVITVQKIPATLEQTWNFFSSPANLGKITPANMAFNTISKFDRQEIFAGQIIEYKISPVLKIPLYWMTEIMEVEPQKFFADEQRKGPYAFWRHEHHFKPIEGGIEMTDIVYYRNPLGFIGKIANGLFVKRELKRIFEYRFQKIEEIFGKWEGQLCFIDIK